MYYDVLYDSRSIRVDNYDNIFFVLNGDNYEMRLVKMHYNSN